MSVSESRWEIRFFTDTFQLEHELEQPVKYTLFRRIPETTYVERVRVEGKEVPFSRENGFLRFETQIDCPRTLSIQLVVAPKKPAKTYAFGGKYQASVALRRLLSEFRANMVARHGFAWGSARWLVNKLKVFSG